MTHAVSHTPAGYSDAQKPAILADRYSNYNDPSASVAPPEYAVPNESGRCPQPCFQAEQHCTCFETQQTAAAFKLSSTAAALKWSRDHAAMSKSMCPLRLVGPGEKIWASQLPNRVSLLPKDSENAAKMPKVAVAKGFKTPKRPKKEKFKVKSANLSRSDSIC